MAFIRVSQILKLFLYFGTECLIGLRSVGEELKMRNFRPKMTNFDTFDFQIFS